MPFLTILEDRCLPAIVVPPADWSQMVAWQKLAPNPVSVSVTVGPATYLPLSLAETTQRALLASAPTDDAMYAGTDALAIQLPRPDGGIERFTLWEIDTFEPALAKQFPTIKTYRGQGIDDPTAIVAADMTEQGFHARVFRGTGGFTIEPMAVVSTGTYRSFYDSDFVAPHGFDCQCALCTTVGESLPKTSTTDSGFSTMTVSNGGTLRSFKLAVASTGEYTAAAGGSVTMALSAITTVVNNVNAIFERDFTVRLNLVAGQSSIIYTNAATDPYTGNNILTMLTENHNNLNTVIGSANYDIGHVFGGLNLGGVAELKSVGNAAEKGMGVSMIGGDNVPTSNWMTYVASHEMGHQFGAGHTFNGISTNLTPNRMEDSAWEPGAGSTIMSYGHINENSQGFVSLADSYFHVGSIEEVIDFLGDINSVGTFTSTGNGLPSISIPGGASKIIPINTPFQLTASATDGNGTITYVFDEMDLGPALSLGAADNGDSPLFRSYPPSTSDNRYFPNLATILANTTYAPETLPTVNNRTLLFRVMARDNIAGGGAQKSIDVTLTAVNTGAQFAVTSPNTAVSWAANSSQTITWNVANTTGFGISAANVKILLSTDGGLTYPTTLKASTSNAAGSAVVTLPNISTTQARIRIQPTNNYFFDVSNANFSITDKSMTAVVTANDLIISDTDSVDNPANNWTITFNGTSYVITDPVEQFVSAPAGGSLSNGDKTLTMPASAFSGKIVFNGNGGADTLTVNHSLGNLLRNVDFNGGTPSAPGDHLFVTKGGFGTATHNLATFHSGSIIYTSFGTVTYTQLESVDMSGSPITDLVFNLPPVASNAFLEDDGVGSNNTSQLRAGNGLFVSTKFANPTTSLTINRGNGNDSLTMTGLPDFNRGLTVGGITTPFGPITLSGPMALVSGYSFTAFSSSTITLSTASSDIAVSGAGSIGLTTTRNIVMASGSSLQSQNGAISLSANQQLTPTSGNFVGIDFDAATITITGTGALAMLGRGGDNTIGLQHGVYVRNAGVVTGGASAAVTITGTGGAAAGSDNRGVVVDGATSKVSSGGADIVVTGIEGATSGSHAIDVTSGSITTAASGGHITLIGNSMNLASTVSANGSSSVTLRPLTNATLINLGAAGDPVGGPLGLTDAELDNITAGTLKIGDANSGAITISADISRSNSTNVLLTTGSAINLNAGLDTLTGNITFASTGAITQTAGAITTTNTLTLAAATGQTATFVTLGNKAGSLVIPVGVTAIIDGSFDATGAVQVDGTLSGKGSVGTTTVTDTGKIAPGTSPGKLTTGNIAFNASSIFNVELNGAVAGTDYDQLAVNGTVNLGAATLSGTAGFTPTSLQVFTIIDNDGTLDNVTGTFNGYIEGAKVTLSGFDFTISYKGGDGNDVTLTRPAAPPTVSTVTFGDGTNQRSLVKQIVVAFSEAVNFTGPVADAFTVSRTGTGAPTGAVSITTNPVSGSASSVTITFSGALTEFDSLIDGLYDFTIDASKVSGAGGALDGDNNTTPGGNYSIVGSLANKYFRYFGDSDGDGAVTQDPDFIEFRNAFGPPSTIFDFDNDGGVDQDDFIKFRNNFGGGP